MFGACFRMLAVVLVSLTFLTATTSLVMFWLCLTGNPVAVHSPLSKEPPLGGAGTLRAAYSMERLATSPSSATEESGVSWLIAGLVDWLAGCWVGWSVGGCVGGWVVVLSVRSVFVCFWSMLGVYCLVSLLASEFCHPGWTVDGFIYF